MKRLIALLLFIVCYLPILHAQQNLLVSDSISNELLSQEVTLDSLFITSDSTKIGVKTNISVGSILTRVINKAQQHAISLSEIKLELGDNLDTTEISKELPTIKTFTEMIKQSISENKDYINLRYLKGLDNLVRTVNEENQKHANNINERVKVYNEIGNKLIEIKSDSLFNLSLKDTTLAPIINSELNSLKKSLRSVDSIFLYSEISLVKFQASASENAISLMEMRQFITENQKRLEKEALGKEINFIWEPSNFEKSITFMEITKQSSLVNLLIIVLYFGRHYISIFLVLAVIVAVFLKIKRIVSKISNENEFASLILDRVKYFRKYTLASTIILIMPFSLIIFKNPPLIFVSILSLLLAIGSTFLVKQQFGSKFHRYWLTFFPAYILIALSGLQWRIAYQERWFILLNSILFLAMGILTLRDLKHKNFTGSIFLRSASIFLIVFQVCSFILNVFGRFNLSKTFAVTGVINFYRAVGLFLFIMVTMEAVYLFTEYNKKGSNGFTSFFDFQDLQKRMKGFLIFFTSTIWLYGVIWHLGYFDHIYEVVSSFLLEDRVLGDTNFQYGSILLFIIIIYISIFLANNIAYFATMQDQKTSLTRKQRLGSSVLLIRLGVLFVGFFIGATAAKIPLDSIAIVLGALSVGIGFGLQTIINNLVSGIILAFERPIQIGDEIEVGTNAGTVKDVGIRASKIRAYDGSEIVIPNGDLLSQSLINWTLSDKKRRVELIIGVSYGSDMKLVKSVIEGVLERDKVMKVPAPQVLMQNFNDNSVDFRVLFWVESMDIWIQMRAEVMSAIFESFAENNIEIPFPQRDLYIKSLPELWKEKVSKPGDGLEKSDSENPEE